MKYRIKKHGCGSRELSDKSCILIDALVAGERWAIEAMKRVEIETHTIIKIKDEIYS